MNENKKKRKGLLIGIICGAVALVAGVVTALILNLGDGGQQSEDPSSQTPASVMSEAERALHEQLAAPGDAVVTLDEDITLTQILSVEGTKTLTGSGTLRSSEGMEYAISVSENAAFTLDGPTVDCTDGATNGIYGGTGSTVTLSSGSIRNTAGHGLRILGKAALTGGSIESTGTNWLMLDAGAEAEITGTSMKDSGENGVITGEGSRLTVRNASMENAKDNMIYNGGTADIDGGTYTGAGNYTFYNGGIMTAKNLDLAGAKVLGYFENGAKGSLTLSDSTLRDSSADFIYNQGEMTVNDVTLDTCTNTAFETKGSKAVVNLNRVTFKSVGQHVLLVKGSKVNLDTVECDQCGSYFCSNRSGQITGTNVKTGKCGGAGFYNELLSDNDLPGTISLDGFEIGETGTYGIRMNSGSIELKNGVVGKATNYGLYVKDGTADVTNVEFLGMLVEGRAVIMNGYNSNIKGVVTMTDCKVTGGARGITNHAIMTLNNCEIYGNRSSGGVHTGAAVSNDLDLTINGGYFHDNHASSSGGAVYSVGKCTIGGGVVIADNSSETSGGGVANSVSADGSHKGVMKIKSCTIRGNYATNYGGGVFNKGTMTVSSGTIRNNSCGKGGGGLENTGRITLSGGTIKNNKSTASGGGLYNGTSGTAELAGVTISGNSTGPDASSGGVHNLGKMTIKSGTKVIDNKAANYGGGVTNSITTDGQKGGTMTISGGTFSGNTCGKGGGGVYNRYNMTISGGTITGNTAGTNGACVYNSGDITIKGGTMKDYPDGKPYDVYIYKGNLNIQGGPDIGSVYKASTGTVTVSGNMDKSVNYFMNSYATGEKALLGTETLIKANRDRFIMPEGALSPAQFVDDQGRIAEEGVDLDTIEAELWIDGKKVDEGLLSLILAKTEKNTTKEETIKIVADATLRSTLDIRYLTTSASDLDKTKTYTLTDDGKAHTITVDIAANPAFYVASSAGGSGNTASSQGYYRGNVVLNIVGNGGLTLRGGKDCASSGILVATNGVLRTSGKVTFEGFTNVSEGGLDTSSAGSRSSGKNGAAVYIGASAKADLNGTVFKDNTNTYGNCGALYASGEVTVKNCTFTGNKALAGNSGAIYITSTSKVSVTGSSFTGNSAVNGGAVYVYQNTSYPVIKDCTFTGNKVSGEASAIYVSSDCTLDMENVTARADDASVSAVRINTGAQVRIGGKADIDWVDLGSAITMKSAFADGSAIAVRIPDADYTDGHQVIAAGGASSDDLAAATGMITLTNDTSEKELRLGTDGRLYRYVAKNAELHRADSVIMIDTLENVAAAAEDLDIIRLTGTADMVNDITLSSDVTLDGAGYSVRSDGKSIIIPAGTGVRLRDITVPELTLEGTLVPDGRLTVSNLKLSSGGLLTAFSALEDGSAIGLTVADDIFAPGTAVITKADEMEFDDFFAMIDMISIKNVNTDNLIISKETETLGTLIVDTKPNAELTRGEEVTEGKFNVFAMALHDGDKIRLLDDVTLTQKILITAALELDGDGHTLTLNNENAGLEVAVKTETETSIDPETSQEVTNEVTKSGVLTITGKLTLAGADGVKLVDPALKVSKGGKLTAQDGTLTVTGVSREGSGAGLYVSVGATADITGATFTDCAAAANGGAVFVDGTLTMTGGSIEGCEAQITSAGGAGAVYVSTGATATLDGVTITDCSSAYNGGALYNNAGTFVLKGDMSISGCSVGSGKNGTVLYSASNAKNEISGGEYSGSIFAYAGSGSSSRITVTGGRFDTSFGVNRGSIAISGGYFTEAPADGFIAYWHECVADSTYEGYGFTVQKKEGEMIEPVASVGETLYGTFDEAIKAAAAGTGAVTVKILADCTTAGGIMTSSDGASTTEGNTGGITLDLNGHTITVTGDQFIRSKTILTIDDTSESGSGSIVGTASSTNVNGFLYQNIGRTLTIKAGTIEAEGTRIVAGSGYKLANVVISGGTIVNRTADGVVLRVNTSSAEISGGYLEGTLAIGSSGAITVSGGSFDHDPSAYVDSKHEAYQEEGVWKIRAKSNVKNEASVDGVEYLTLSEAKDAAVEKTKDGGSATVVLLTDVTLSARLNFCIGTSLTNDEAERTIVFDLNGHKLSAPSLTSGALGVSRFAHFTIKDSVGGGELGVSSGYSIYLPGTYCYLTYESGKFTGVTSFKRAEGHHVTIAGGTYDMNPSSYVDTDAYIVTDNGNGTWTVSAAN
ncbi:MAG: hypothetical protein IJS22_04865 [Lachnospiraceae bacterium]|nr:hypothetical protein [Lachnospiraceae bacterium]